MAEASLQPCSFFLLRYVPDAVKNEFVNIGVVLLPAGAPPEFRLTSDWSRVQGLDPRVDLDLLQALGNDLRAQFTSTTADRAALMKKIEDSFSNALQASEYKVCLTDAPAREADELARIYIESPRRPPVRERGARQEMRQRMEQEWKKAGVDHAISREIAVSKYTRPGDPLEIDFGYRHRTEPLVKMFHATALAASPNAAKVLAFSYPAIADGIRKKESAQLQLTAVVEDNLESSDDTIGFARQTLEGQGIVVALLSTMPDIAKQAARDLGIL